MSYEKNVNEFNHETYRKENNTRFPINAKESVDIEDLGEWLAFWKADKKCPFVPSEAKSFTINSLPRKSI